MDTKIQNWLKKHDRESFTNWKNGEYSKVILCTFEDWKEGKYQAGLNKGPDVKAERLFDEDGQNSSLTLYILTPKEYEKISEEKKALADRYISKELTAWKTRFEAGHGKSKEPERYLQMETERVTQALEDPSLHIFDSVTGLQMVIGATYSKTSDRPHPDHHGQTFQNEIAYYHYYNWIVPSEDVNYWDSLNLPHYQEWQKFGWHPFNTVSSGCNARILAQYREYLREQAEPEQPLQWMLACFYKYLEKTDYETPYKTKRTLEAAYNAIAEKHAVSVGNFKNWTLKTTTLAQRKKLLARGLQTGRTKQLFEMLAPYPKALQECRKEAGLASDNDKP